MVNVALGSDHGGYRLKQEIIMYLEEKGIPYKDFGCEDTSSCDYPEFGLRRQKRWRPENMRRELSYAQQESVYRLQRIK